MAREEQRTLLTGDDIVRAAAKLGFDEYIAPLTRYLELYRAANRSSTAPDSTVASVATVVDFGGDDAPNNDDANKNVPLIVPSTEAAEFIDLPPPKFDDDDA
jgi:hypothetical protein